jgi:hypothetical protein
MERQERDMTKHLDDVLNAYAHSDPEPSRDALREWVVRYPHFVHELTAFTARWRLLVWTADPSLLEGAETNAQAEAVTEDRLILRAVSAAQAAFYNKNQSRSRSQVSASESEPAMQGLLQEAKGIGLTSEHLAALIQLSDSLLRKLDRRLIAPSSTPTDIPSRLARALGRSASSIERYLQLPPTLPAGARYLAKKAPRLTAKQEDFYDAVRNDVRLNDAQREALLALPRPPGSGPDPSTREQ